MHGTFLLILLYNITIREGQYLFYIIENNACLCHSVIKIADGLYPSAILSIIYSFSRQVLPQESVLLSLSNCLFLLFIDFHRAFADVTKVNNIGILRDFFQVKCIDFFPAVPADQRDRVTDLRLGNIRDI